MPGMTRWRSSTPRWARPSWDRHRARKQVKSRVKSRVQDLIRDLVEDLGRDPVEDLGRGLVIGRGAFLQRVQARSWGE